MAAPLPFSESELRLLGVLLRRKVRFMIVGLSAATLQGAPVVTQDVDLWFENARPRPIPKGLRPPAQGCEARATLGHGSQMETNPNGVVAKTEPE